MLLSAEHASGLKITAGQRKMSGQDNHLSGKTFLSSKVRVPRKKQIISFLLHYLSEKKEYIIVYRINIIPF